MTTPVQAEHTPLLALERLARAGTPLVVSECADLDWIETLASRLGEIMERPSFRWSLAGGLVPLCLKGTPSPALRKPNEVIAYLASERATPSIVVLTDIGYALEKEETQSALRDLAREVDSHQHLLILTTFGDPLPASLRNYAAVFDPGLPNAEQLMEVITEEANLWGERNAKRVKATQAAIDAVIRTTLGLSRQQARKIIRLAIADGVLDESDIPALQTGKYEALSTDGVIEAIPHSEKLANVAGLENFKAWLELRKLAFLADKPPRGLDRPKGVLLLGVPGSGKSLSAKAVAGTWGLSLLRLDMGSIYNKYHGETERNLREALRAADVMAPVVLWLDEIEKLLAQSDNDAVSKRVLGTLLTWMNDHTSRVFLVATANDVMSLPPELLRKGRFDEIFFLDLPGKQVRADAFAIHLKRREFDVSSFDLPALAEATNGFTGAEIEQVVRSGSYAAAGAGDNELTTEMLISAARSTKPLSVLRASEMQALRNWAASRTVSADLTETVASADIEDIRHAT